MKQRRNNIFFLGFDYNVLEHSREEGNVTCPHYIKTIHFNQGILIKNKRQYLFVIYKTRFSRNTSCSRFNLL
jgi:hypothetical protein